jgi:hypothetical protein
MVTRINGGYLLDVVEVSLHTLNSDVLVGLGALCLEHLTESTLALLANQAVL